MNKFFVFALCSAALLGGCYNEIEPEPASERGGLLPIAGAYNVRDLGGIKTTDGKSVKSGKLIRSGDLNLLTGRDQDYLYGTVGITTIVDFRGEKAGTDDGLAVLSERANSPDRAPDSIVRAAGTAIEESLLIGSYEDIIQETDTVEEARQKMIDGYKALVMGAAGANAQAQFKAFFQALIDSGGSPVLYHCSAGKDRTGIATMLLLSALGVDQQAIIANFTASAQFVAEKYHPVSFFIAKTTGEQMKAQRDSDSVKNAAAALNSGNEQYVSGVKAQFKERIKQGIRESIVGRIRAGLVDRGQPIDTVNSMTEDQIDAILTAAGQYTIEQQYQGALQQMGDASIDGMVEDQCDSIKSLAAMTDAQIDGFAQLAGEKVKPLLTVKAEYLEAAMDAINGYSSGSDSGMAGYLKNVMGLTDANITTLKGFYLE